MKLASLDKFLKNIQISYKFVQ